MAIQGWVDDASSLNEVPTQVILRWCKEKRSTDKGQEVFRTWNIPNE